MTVATIGSEYAPCMEYLPSGLVNVGIKTKVPYMEPGAYGQPRGPQ